MTTTVPGEPLVVQTHGYTPKFWEGVSVVFVANLLSLFFGNRGETYLLEENISGVDSYGSRLLPVVSLLFANGENLLVLEREPDPALPEYFCQELGLPLPEVAVLPDADYRSLCACAARGALPDLPIVRQLAGHPAGLVDGFVTDIGLSQLSAGLGKTTLSSPEGSHRGNNKYLLHRAIEAAGLPTFDTKLVDTPADVAKVVRSFADLGYAHVAVKAQVGASGIGLMRVPTTGDCSTRAPFFLS